MLLIACLNVANLLLARASSRREEISLRLTLGATRGRIVRQLLSAASPGIPRTDAVGLDVRVLAFTAAVALLTGLIFGTASAWPGSRAASAGAAQTSARTVRNGLRTGRLSVGAEVALSVLLLAGAGLLIVSLSQLSGTDLGFDPSRITAVTFQRLPPGLEQPERREVLERTMLDQVRALGGVDVAAVAAN